MQYLKNDGRREIAQQMAAHESPHTMYFLCTSNIRGRCLNFSDAFQCMAFIVQALNEIDGLYRPHHMTSLCLCNSTPKGDRFPRLRLTLVSRLTLANVSAEANVFRAPAMKLTARTESVRADRGRHRSCVVT
jgi:hypothetical protein